MFSTPPFVPPPVESPSEFAASTNRNLPSSQSIISDYPRILEEPTRHIGEENPVHLENDPNCLLGPVAQHQTRPTNSSSEPHSIIPSNMQSISSLDQSSVAIAEEAPESVNSTVLTQNSAQTSSFPTADKSISVQMTESPLGTPVPWPLALSNTNISTPFTISTSQQNRHSLPPSQSLEQQSSDLVQDPFACEGEVEPRGESQNTIPVISTATGCKLSLREVIRLSSEDPDIVQFGPFPQFTTEVSIPSESLWCTTKSTQTQFPYSPKKVRFIQFSETSDKSTQTEILQELNPERRTALRHYIY